MAKIVKLRRFWIRFRGGDAPGVVTGAGLALGCGVTAYTIEDALQLVQEKVFGGNVLPSIENIVEDIDIPGLDQRHVVPNMAPPNWRGVWFPAGYADAQKP